MKKYWAICMGVLLASWGGSALAQAAGGDLQAGTLLKFHSVGTRSLVATPSAESLQKIAALPITETYFAEVLDKVSASLGAHWQDADAAALIRSVIRDLVTEESHILVRETEGGKVEWAVVVKAGADQTTTWSSSILALGPKLIKHVKFPQSGESRPNWTAQTDNPERVFQFRSVGDWVAFGMGAKQAPLPATIAGRLKGGESPLPSETGKALELSVDLSTIAERRGRKVAEKLPHLRVTAAIEDGKITSAATLKFPMPIKIDLDPWRIPTNTIQDPLIEFAAVRGIAPLVSHDPAVRKFLPQPAPNQLFLWSRFEVPYLISAAVPAPEATKQVDRIGPALLKELQQSVINPAFGRLEYVTNIHSLQWRNLLPFVIPFLRPAPEPGDDFIYTGLFPIDLSKSTNPPPAALLKEVTGNDDLVFYHWEVTAPRLERLKTLFQVLSLLSKNPTAGAKDASMTWVSQAAPYLGNTITEVSQVAPDEIAVKRRSHIGLNSFEIMMLTHWTATGRFPDKFPTLPFLPLLHDPAEEAPAKAAPPGPGAPGK